MGPIFVKLAMNFLRQKATEQFIKTVVVELLEVVVKQTESDLDDRILQSAKSAWGYEDAQG